MNYEQILNEKLKKNEYSLKEAQAIFDYAINLQQKGIPVIFDRYHFSLYLHISDSYLIRLTDTNYIDNQYNTFYIPKKNGEQREINAPKEKLKSIQVWIYNNILSKLTVSCAAKAYVKKRSIIDNARFHVGKNFIIKLDFENFFNNILFERIYNLFIETGYTKGVAYTLSRLCTFQGHLAQGAPTSPALSNLCCRMLDKRLLNYCQKNNYNYTRYADDITISSSSLFNNNNIMTFKNIISQEGYKLNTTKSKFLNKNQRHLITGIVTNKKLSVLHSIKNKLRQEIYYCKKFGVNDHLSHQGKVYSFYKEHLTGMAYYIYMIEKNTGAKFLKQLHDINWDY